ncbi:MAG TPA: alpha/beta hydrolase [Burkholderiaceae bacterium]|nr:alpha/beta hydrolase [Burkholderiaceae bacterium]
MNRDDGAQLDAQYNNRTLVPGHEKIFARWREASALTRLRASRRIGLCYGEGPSETLDLFLSARDGAPVFVFIHGGYWRSMDKAEHSFVAASFMADGAMVVVPNYALCPQVTIETIALQMAKTVAWTYRHAALYGGDPNRIIVGGHSAGGHLAAMLLCCDWPSVAPDLPPGLVQGAVSISGLFDLEPLSRTPFLKDDLQLTTESVRRLSPVNFPPPSYGRLMAFVGDEESSEFHRQSALLRQHWGENSVPVCETVPNTNHFTVLHELANPRSRIHALTCKLMGLEE